MSDTPTANEPPPLRVILAEDIARGVRDLQTLAAFPETVTVCGVVRSPLSMLEQMEVHRPDLLILTEAFLGSDVEATLSEVHQAAPDCRLILLSGAPEVAVRGGGAVLEVLSDDVPASELLAAVQRAATGATAEPPPVETDNPFQKLVSRRIQRGSRSRCQTLLVFSGKGGVGSTTIAVNLAIGLAMNREARVAILDLDLQFGDVGLLLGLDANHSIDELPDAEDAIPSGALEAALLPTPWGVRALLAPTRPELADLVTVRTVKDVIQGLTADHDYLVVDAPCHLDDRCLQALEMSDSVVVVTGFTLASLRDTQATLALLAALAHPMGATSVVLNQGRPHATLSREEVRRMLGFDVVAQLPYDPRVVDEAGESGKPFLVAEPKSEISRQFRSLLDVLAPASGGAPSPDPGGGRRRFSLGRSN